MLGFAEFKSHVQKRDEKGLFGIPFKRLLGCGLGAGALFTLLRMVLPDSAGLFGVAGLALLLILTAPRGGIARYKHLWYSVRWRLVSAASLAPDSVTGQLARALGLPATGIDLDADALFHADGDTPQTDLSDWVSFTRPLTESDTLTFAPAPGLALHGDGS